MISKKFIRVSLIYTLAGTLPMANAIILLPLYLHYLTAEAFGSLAFYLSFSILIQIIVTYSFDASLYLYYHEYKNDREKLSSLVSSSFLFILLIGLGLGLVLMVAGSFVFDYFFHAQHISFYPYGFLSVLTAVFQSVFKVNNSLLQSREKPERFLWSNLISFAMVATFTIVGLVVYPDTLMGPIGGKMVAVALSSGWVLASIYREFGFSFDFTLLRQTFQYSSYQLIYQLQQWVINYFDRPIMAWVATLTDLGIYDFTLKCLIVIDLIISALVNSFMPKILSKTIGQNTTHTTPEINRYYHGLTAASMLMVSGAILLLPILIDVFVTKQGYQRAAEFVPYACLVFLLRGMRFYFGLPYSIKKDSKPLPVIFLIISVSKVTFSILFIRQFGIYGAIGATLAASVVEIIFLWLWMRRKFDFIFNPFKMLIAPLLLLFVIAVGEPLLSGTNPIPVHLAYVAFTVILLVWSYRKELVWIVPFLSDDNKVD